MRRLHLYKHTYPSFTAPFVAFARQGAVNFEAKAAEHDAHLGKSAEYVNCYTERIHNRVGRWEEKGYISGGLAALGILMLGAEFRD